MRNKRRETLITEKDIHRALCRVRPLTTIRWRHVSKKAKRLYRAMAHELNRKLEGDVVTIVAVRCSTCGELLDTIHAEHHACWEVK